jgi:hypothetical protein
VVLGYETGLVRFLTLAFEGNITLRPLVDYQFEECAIFYDTTVDGDTVHVALASFEGMLTLVRLKWDQTWVFSRETIYLKYFLS